MRDDNIRLFVVLIPRNLQPLTGSVDADTGARQCLFFVPSTAPWFYCLSGWLFFQHHSARLLISPLYEGLFMCQNGIHIIVIFHQHPKYPSISEKVSGFVPFQLATAGNTAPSVSLLLLCETRFRWLLVVLIHFILYLFQSWMGEGRQELLQWQQSGPLLC